MGFSARRRKFLVSVKCRSYSGTVADLDLKQSAQTNYLFRTELVHLLDVFELLRNCCLSCRSRRCKVGSQCWSAGADPRHLRYAAASKAGFLARGGSQSGGLAQIDVFNQECGLLNISPGRMYGFRTAPRADAGQLSSHDNCTVLLQGFEVLVSWADRGETQTRSEIDPWFAPHCCVSVGTLPRCR